MNRVNQETINQRVNSSAPQRLSLVERPPITDDHAAHIIQLTQWGQTSLAADHLLFPEINGALANTVSGVIRGLNIHFVSSKPDRNEPEASFREKIHSRQYSYEILLEMALNFYGLESRWLDEGEKSECLSYILNTLDEWETREREENGLSVAKAVVEKWLTALKRVQKGNSMVAKTAFRIEEGLDFQKNFLFEFLKKAEKEITGNVYYRMVKAGGCKFGNDYALGLRWLRHLGFEQVSTNPVLAARAYQDEPILHQVFQEEFKRHPDCRRWSSSTSTHGDEITLFATLLALWDNLYVFRPVFFNLRDTSGGGVVSFQLNPNIAHLVEESIRDVFKAFSLASKNLSNYDRYLLAGYRIDGEKGRPNMVIKVAASTPAARMITRTINSFGFGSNITVDYSVSQEAMLILEEMEGMAKAVRKGIRPTQLYMTNMGGRLESHLREIKLEELFQELQKAVGEKTAMERILKLSETNGSYEKASQAKTYEEKVLAATRFAVQKTINDPVCEALNKIAPKEFLLEWEKALGRSGTLIARRVWGIFFSEANRGHWITYLMDKKCLTQQQASLVLDRIHYLPASKRKPFDTYWTLACRNLVHTEFPDHQENVRKMSVDPQFNLEECGESIQGSFPSDVLERLNQMADFRKAYEINPELAGIFKEVGIQDDFGLGGLNPSDWPGFGPVQKTLTEFKAAYDSFYQEIVSSLKKPTTKKKSSKKRPKRIAPPKKKGKK
ncbi:MAG TPA: hypothetical protein VLK23_10060 [Thermodesulfobacteriota bacterium]|nr:hypothetical protein [Thermodesulfobacteriota bacterium]